jgi:hypothetical protein
VTSDVIDVLALEEFEAEWGVVDLGRLARWGRQVRDRDLQRTDRFLAQYAQQLRAERVALGHREETRAFYGEGEHRGRGVERRLRVADWEHERRAEVAHRRDQPLVHGTASGFAGCAPKGQPRCETCRTYQRERSRANRADRLRRGLCTATRSSYDAGCRCGRCTAANSSACASWRARRQDQVEGVAA